MTTAASAGTIGVALKGGRRPDDLLWALEADRWAELVFCLVSAYGDDDPVRARQVTSALAGAGLCAPESLAGLANTSGDAHAAARYVLAHHGIGEGECQTLPLASMGRGGRSPAFR